MQDIAEERNQEQIALQLNCRHLISHFGKQTAGDVALQSGTLLLEGKNEFCYPWALAAIGGFICEEFILKIRNTSGAWCSCFYFFSTRICTNFNFLKTFWSLIFCHIGYFLRESLCKDISGIIFFATEYTAEFIHLIIFAPQNTIKDQVNNFLEIVFCKLQCSL